MRGACEGWWVEGIDSTPEPDYLHDYRIMPAMSFGEVFKAFCDLAHVQD